MFFTFLFIHPFSHHFASLITELKIYLAWAISHQYFNTWKLLAFKTFNHSRMNAKISEIPFPRASPDIHVWSCQILSISDFGNRFKMNNSVCVTGVKKFFFTWMILELKTQNCSRMNSRILKIFFPWALADIHLSSFQVSSLWHFGNRSKMNAQFVISVWEDFSHKKW